MSAPQSIISESAIAIQSGKGTPATTGFLSFRAQQSQLFPTFDQVQAPPEHFYGANQLPVLTRTAGYRTGYVAAFGGRGRLYPDAITKLMAGLGFTTTTTAGDDTDYSHVQVLAARSSQPWLTFLALIGEGADEFERRATDARLTQLSLDSSIKGNNLSFQGVALTEDDAVGTETKSTEDSTPILPTNGSATITIDGWDLTVGFMASQMNFRNMLDTEDQALFSTSRRNLTSLGLGLGGRLLGVDVSQGLYNRLTRGAAAGTAPAMSTPEGSVTIKFESEENIPGCSVPYSVQFEVPNVEFALAPFGSTGTSLIRTAISWNMLGQTGTPVTVTSVNEQSGP